MIGIRGHRPSSAAAVALTVAAVGFLTLFVVLPLLAIFLTALRDGVGEYLRTFTRTATVQSTMLTLGVTLVSVPVTVVFGLFASWALAKFRFPGRNLLISAIDLPLSLSPIVVGVMIVSVYGRFGLFGGFLEAHGIRVVFARPSLVLTNLLIILPFVVREVLPTLEELGSEQEEAAATLGASGFRTYLSVPLPSIKWAVVYGVLLAAARSAGEFGAASIVSGLRRGRTVTLPIQIELFYAEYQTAAAFSAATLFTLFALITVVVKSSVRPSVPRSPIDRGHDDSQILRRNPEP